MILFIAIDGVICTVGHNHCYERAHPIPEAIAKVNALYDGGNTVVLWTSRFTVTGLPSIIDFTRKQLATWGVRYTAIEFSKPEYDAFVDSKATTLDALVKGEDGTVPKR